jgi:glycosyltransferase involved in cell wall biosynthesis
LKIAHIITGLSTGGAEMMLLRLVKQQQAMGVEAVVFSLVSDGELKPRIQAEGIQVIDLGFPRGRINLSGFLCLVKNLRKCKPDLVLCWMYHANLIGGLAARLAGSAPVVWSIHNTTLNPKTSSKMTIRIMKFSALLSFLPAKIITCSESSRKIHEQVGYRRDKFVVIPNGFDTVLFHPNGNAGNQLKIELGIYTSKRLVGVIGRNDPQKDFPTFIQAATLIAQVNQNVEFILCGQGLSEDNTELMNLIKQAEIVDRFHLLGRRTEIELVYQALDILVSSSAYGEAFPMVIGEAMACGVPCVATDIGDTRFLIDDTGLVVPPKNPQTLASAVISLLSMADGEFQQKKALARKQILEHFSLPQIAEQYAEEFKKLIHS